MKEQKEIAGKPRLQLPKPPRRKKKIKKIIAFNSKPKIGGKKKNRRLIRVLLSEIERLKSLKTTKREKHPFYDSRAWLDMRYKALKLNGRVCLACRRSNVEMHVDHIKPRSIYPHLELTLSNLQVLCKDCNLGKSNVDETDWRTK